jgi:hypothetical protein
MDIAGAHVLTVHDVGIDLDAAVVEETGPF